LIVVSHFCDVLASGTSHGYSFILHDLAFGQPLPFMCVLIPFPLRAQQCIICAVIVIHIWLSVTTHVCEDFVVAEYGHSSQQRFIITAWG
jgi:hypothetical protein